MYIEDEWGKLKTVIIGRSEEYLNSTKSEKQKETEMSILNKIQEIMEGKNIKVIKPKYKRFRH
jgi:hypothetical protein